MTTRVYVPRDAAALAMGADAVASLLRQAGDVEVVRTGSRGLFWLEPMVEVATAEGRIAYGPVTVADISGSARCRHAGGRCAQAAPGAAGGTAVPCETDAAHVRALRHRRSAVAR